MDRNEVKSSNIISIGFDSATSTLEIQFKGKGKPIWQYTPITQEGYNQLMSAESKGEYFHKNIKNNPLVTAKRVEAK